MAAPMTGDAAMRLLLSQARPHFPELGRYLLAGVEDDPEHGPIWRGDQTAFCLYLTKLMAPGDDLLLGLQLVAAIRKVAFEPDLYEAFLTTLVRQSLFAVEGFCDLQSAEVAGSC